MAWIRKVQFVDACLCLMGAGQHYFVTARYLDQYATDPAWKENNRRLSSGDAFTRTISLTMASPMSDKGAKIQHAGE